VPGEAYNALYFPYIRVPNSSWFTRVLLYWDQVGAIVPEEFLLDPNRLGTYMVELVRAGLVRQVIPGIYLWDVPRFADSFLEYVDAEATRADWLERLSRSPAATWTTIHAEKIERLGDELIRRGLARRTARSSWYAVEPRTAAAFMAYLAAVLGQRPGLEFAPITDRTSALAPFFATRRRLFTTLRKSAVLEDVGATILRGVLPAPAGFVPPQDLADFKSKHQKTLPAFRNRVELVVNELASISDAEDRMRTARAKMAVLNDEINSIAAQMKLNWTKIVFGSLCTLSSAVLSVATPAPPVGAISAVLGLSSAVYTATEPFRDRRNARQKPLAYAALAQGRFGRTAGSTT